MTKIKFKRSAPSVDMTAMSDVTFLLLNFFVMTATFRPAEPVPVDTPSSIISDKVPDEDYAVITITKDGKCFLSIAGREIREATLNLMGSKYGIEFSEEEKEAFTLLDNFGVPLAKLPKLLAMTTQEQLEPNTQTGIVVDSTTNSSNELYNWIFYARTAINSLKDKQLKILIKADEGSKYPHVSKVINVLQDQKINKFGFVTSLKSVDN